MSNDDDYVGFVEEELFHSDDDEEIFELDEEAIQYANDLRKANEKTFDSLTPDAIVDKMALDIQLVCVQINQSANTCRILLHHYNWNRDQLLQDFYYRRENFLKILNDLGILVNKNPAQGNENKQEGSDPTIECPLCCMEVSNEDFVTADCGHKACVQCWTTYLTKAIKDEGRGMLICCPDCSTFVGDKLIRELIQDKAVVAKYQDSLVRAFVEKCPLTKWCPKEGCPGMVIHIKPHTEKKPVTCGCGFEHCFSCGLMWHSPLNCELTKKWSTKITDNSETDNWLKSNTKLCPKCKLSIEKSGGCNYMTCSNVNCKYHFCWICLGPAHDHSFGESCGRFKEIQNTEAVVSEKKTREAAKAALNRYNFYMNRYNGHMESLKFEEKLKESVRGRLNQVYDKFESRVTSLDTAGFEEAIQILCRCRRMLAHAFVFSFYLEKSNGAHQVEMYELNVDNLHKQTEKLSHTLEQGLDRMIDSVESFSTIKIKVINLSKFCDERRIKVINHVQEEEEKGTWKIQAKLLEEEEKETNK